MGQQRLGRLRVESSQIYIRYVFLLFLRLHHVNVTFTTFWIVPKQTNPLSLDFPQVLNIYSNKLVHILSQEVFLTNSNCNITRGKNVLMSKLEEKVCPASCRQQRLGCTSWYFFTSSWKLLQQYICGCLVLQEAVVSCNLAPSGTECLVQFIFEIPLSRTLALSGIRASQKKKGFLLAAIWQKVTGFLFAPSKIFMPSARICIVLNPSACYLY